MITEKMLTQSLRGRGPAHRLPPIPPLVDYELIALGQTLRNPLKALGVCIARMVGHLIMGGGSFGGVNQRARLAMDAALARGP